MSKWLSLKLTFNLFRTTIIIFKECMTYVCIYWENMKLSATNNSLHTLVARFLVKWQCMIMNSSMLIYIQEEIRTVIWFFCTQKLWNRDISSPCSLKKLRKLLTEIFLHRDNAPFDVVQEAVNNRDVM